MIEKLLRHLGLPVDPPAPAPARPAEWLPGFEPAAEVPNELLHPACVAWQRPVGVPRSSCSKAEWTRLAAGQVVVVERAVMQTSRDGTDSVVRENEAAVLVPRPAGEVWAVLTDYASRPRLLPNVGEARIERVEGTRAWVRQRLDVFWAEVHSTLIFDMDPSHGVIRSVMDHSAPHDICDTSGFWQIVPQGETSALLLSRDRIDTGRPVPGVVESHLMRQSLPGVMCSLRDEVERRARVAADSRAELGSVRVSGVPATSPRRPGVLSPRASRARALAGAGVVDVDPLAGPSTVLPGSRRWGPG